MFKYVLPAIVLLAACHASRTTTMQFATNPVIAHRGAFRANAYPENSVAALKEALRLGCAGTEFDVWMTGDDSLVVNHDPDYGGLSIETTSYTALAVHRLSNGESLPLLRRFLQAGMEGNRQTRLVVEIKPSRLGEARGEKTAAAVVRLVQELGARAYVTYISFDYNMLKKILSLDAAASTQYLQGDRSPAELKADGIAGLDYHYSVFKKHPGWITQARQLGLKLNAWTVNDSADMDWLLAEKFDYITTNEPELLLRKYRGTKN